MPTVRTGRADIIFYRLSLTGGDRQSTVWFNDVSAPASVRRLLAFLRRLPTEQKRKGI